MAGWRNPYDRTSAGAGAIFGSIVGAIFGAIAGGIVGSDGDDFLVVVGGIAFVGLIGSVVLYVPVGTMFGALVGGAIFSVNSGDD